MSVWSRGLPGFNEKKTAYIPVRVVHHWYDYTCNWWTLHWLYGPNLDLLQYTYCTLHVFISYLQGFKLINSSVVYLTVSTESLTIFAVHQIWKFILKEKFSWKCT